MNNLPNDPSERLKALQELFYKTFINFFSGGTYNNIFLGLFSELNTNLKKVDVTFDSFNERLTKMNESFNLLNENFTNADESSTNLTKALNKITIAGVIIAGLSLFGTLWMAQTARYDAQMNEAAIISQRPYINLIDPKINLISTNNYQLVSEIENVGNRPAKNMNIEFYPIASVDNQKEPYGFNIGWCDEIIQLSSLVFPHKKLPETYTSAAPHYEDPTLLKYAVVRISYEDSIMNERYAQVFYYKWQIDSLLSQLINQKDKNNIDEYLKQAATFCKTTLGKDHDLAGFWSTISSMSEWNN